MKTYYVFVYSGDRLLQIKKVTKEEALSHVKNSGRVRT